MKNLNKVIIAGLLASTAITSAHAAAKSPEFVLKARAGYMHVSDGFKTQSGTVNVMNTATTPAKIGDAKITGKLNTKNGYALEVAADYFLTPNFAVEAAVGYGRSKINVLETALSTDLDTTTITSGVTIAAPFANLEKDKVLTLNKAKKNLTIVPITVTGLYHFAPESEFSPYAGLGYAYEVASTSLTGAKVKNGGGFVAQLGGDFKMNETMSINFDVKYTHKVSHDVTINTVSLGKVKVKNKMSNVRAMLGVAFPM